MKAAGLSSLIALLAVAVSVQPRLGASQTSTTLSGSHNPSVFGNSIILTATVQSSTTPAGTVAFYNGVTLLGKATVTNGQAAIKTVLPSGQWPLKAVYSGGNSSILAHTVSSTAAGSFSAPVTSKAGNGPYSVAAGDFNGDGTTDLAVANQIDGTVSVLLGDGRGNFQTAVNYPTGAAPQSVIVGDFNGDGNLDLATANYYSSNVSVLLGKGDGTFEPAVNYGTAMNPRTVAAGDFNGDGNFDLAVAGSSGNVSVLLGNGDGTFRTPVDYSVGSGPISVAVGDFNGDGISDLAVTNNVSGSLSVLLGKGDGSFRAAVNYTVGKSPYDVVVSDFDGDGKADLAVALGASSVAVLLGNGDGTFQPALGYGKFIGPIGLAVEDFNGDGIPDIVSADAGAGAVSVLLGNGDGTFLPPANYAAVSNPMAVAVADFNSDGIPDLVTANNGGANIGVLLGVAPSQAQTIALGPLSSLTLGVPPFTIAATASSGLAVSFISTTPTACTVEGNTVAIAAAGTCSITALQAGNAVFHAAPPVTRTFAVSPEASAAAPVTRTLASPGLTSQTITFDKIPNQIFGISPFEIAVQSTSGLPLSILSTTTTVCGSSSGLVTLLSTGTCSIAASQGGNATYSAATPATRSFTVTQAKPAGTLTPAVGSPFPVGGSPVSTVVGDFNGDGIEDLAVTNYFFDFGSVTVLLGNGSGGFTAAAGSPFAVGSNPGSIVVGDFNGDGFQDLATANFGGLGPNYDCMDLPTEPGSVTVLLGDGKGGFTEVSGSPFVVGYGASSIVVGDFNGDGIQDFATANNSDNTVTVLMGNGSGGFTPTAGSPVAVGGGPVSVAAGDFNRDGIQDLAVLNSGDSTITVLLGNGSGGFTPASGGPVAVGGGLGSMLYPVAVVAGDFNRDGIQDLAIADPSGDSVAVLLGNTLGGFTAAKGSPFPAGSDPVSIVVGDFNGDGIQDLFFANANDNNTSSTLTVLLGNGLGAFTAAAGSPFAVGSNPASVVVGDFNGDGVQDVAAANNNDGTLTVLLGGPAFTNSVLTTIAPSIIAPGQSVPLALTVSSRASKSPTGTATFLDGSTVLGTATQTGSPYTFSTSGLGVGSHTLSANYGGDSGHAASSSNTIIIQVNGALTLQTIAFAPLANQALGSSPPPLSATVNSGLAVKYSSNTTGVCTVTGANITLVTAGTCSITASQPGNSTYAAATPVIRTFISIGLQTIRFDAIPNQIFGVSPFPIAAQSSVLLPVGFKSITPAVCRISDDLVMLLGAGTCSITASQPGNASYSAASATRSLSVTVAKPSNSFFAAPGSPIAVPNGVSYMAEGNIIGTGVPDLVVLNARVNPYNVDCLGALPTTLTVMQGNGSGGFVPGTPLDFFQTGQNPVAVAVGDFNGDGFEDLAVANPASEIPGCFFGGGPGQIQVLLGDGSGGFTPPPSGAPAFGTDSQPVSLAVGDFNGDGLQDLAVADSNNTVWVLLGDGSGDFAVSNTISVVGAVYVVIGDFNGDGIEDLAVAGSNNGSGLITVLLGDGSGGFTAAKGSPFAVGTTPFSLVVGDFNGDGHQDLAAANGLENNLTVLLGDGMGGFTATAGSPFAVGTVPLSLVVGDFNGDGHQDLAAASGDSVTVLLGDGAGRFTAAARSPFSVGTGPYSLVVGDFNRDGIEDLATANVAGNNVTVLLGYLEGTTPQTITFGALSAQPLGSTPPALSATASSGLAVMFNSNTTPVCTVSGVYVTLVAVGTCSITANQPGNPTFAAAAPVTRTFTVSPQPPAIVSLSPKTGAGTAVAFRAVYSDPNGAGYLNELLLQINSSQSGANACYVYYQPSGNHLYLASNAGNAWMTPALTPGVAGTASNSQCTLNAGSSAVTTAGNDLTLTVELTFSATFVGAKNVYLYAAGMTGFTGTNSGWVKEGTWVPTSAGPPAIVSLTPNAGAGKPVTFKAVYSDPNGADDLNELLLQINSSQSSANACYVYYQPQGNHLYLASNAGSGWITPALTPGVAGTAANSQCTLNARSSSVTTAGNNLALSVALTFSGTVVGSKNVYLYAAGLSGQNSGWVKSGTRVPTSAGPPAIVSLSPNSGSGTSVTFKAVYADPNGAGDLDELLLQVNASQSSGNACYVYYQPQGNHLYLASNAGNVWMTPALTPGVAGTAINSQCTLNAGSSSVTTAGNDLTLNIALSYNSSFTGSRNVYLYAAGFSGQNTGWVKEGAWTPNPVGPPAIVSLSPSSGTGTTVTFKAVYSDPNGSGDLSIVLLQVNASQSSGNACYVYYQPQGNHLYLANNTGAWITPALTPGVAGTASNSQCTLNAGSSSVTMAGNDLTLNVALTFSGTFTGAKNVYLYAAGLNGKNSGWLKEGAWTP